MNTTYKFLPPERMSYLENELLRITQPNDLNDPYECLSVPPSTDEAIKLCIKSQEEFLQNSDTEDLSEELKKDKLKFFKQALNDEIEKIRENVHPNYKDYLIENQKKRINASIFILSFSKIWNSSVMWAHYAKNHTGFCVGFDKEDAIFKRKGNSSSLGLMPVKYSKKRIKVPVDNDKVFKYAIKTILTKSLDWKYEKEERLIASEKDIHKNTHQNNHKINLMKIPNSLIKEIIVGRDMKIDDLNFIHKFCEIKKIPLYQCKISETMFDMEKQLITAYNKV